MYRTYIPGHNKGEKENTKKYIQVFFRVFHTLILTDLHNAVFLKMMTQVLFCTRHRNPKDGEVESNEEISCGCRRASSRICINYDSIVIGSGL